ncbi:MAG: FMN-binding protein [Planctomycetaceae bacterium]|nr:FMN-binding protein [Planctomycetaceae bacterium]
MIQCAIAFSILALLFTTPCCLGEDVVELNNGTTIRGKVTSQSGSNVVIEVIVKGKAYTRRYPKENVAAVRLDDGSQPSSPANSSVPTRSRKEVLDLINSIGRTPPEWFDSTQLNYPDTLDLSWPQPPPQPWNNSKNVGQFIWDRVNPNPSQWRGGVKLMHHIMVTQNSNKQTVTRAMMSLGAMYHNLFEDYARAAFWWQQAGVDKGKVPEPLPVVHLANCYFQLGSKDLALETLKNLTRYPPATIKLLGDIGNTEDALKLAESGAKGGTPLVSYLYAGDVCRVAGRLAEAEQYYRKAVDAADRDKSRGDAHVIRDKGRAIASLAAIQFYQLSPKDVVDGTYVASSLGYEDQVEVSVVVAAGVITEVKVTRHREKQFYSSITDTPRAIIDRQTMVGIDTTSGATITSEAIINATALALAKGKK